MHDEKISHFSFSLSETHAYAHTLDRKFQALLIHSPLNLPSLHLVHLKTSFSAEETGCTFGRTSSILFRSGAPGEHFMIAGVY